MIEAMKKAVMAIRQARTIVIAGHINPDGDSIGSLISLGLGLKKYGKKVYMICPDTIPETYAFLPGLRYISKTTPKRVDLAISVDCSTYDVLGKSKAVFDRACKILEIDHHLFRQDFGDIKLVDDKADSVGEIIFHLIKSLRIQITKDIAVNILTSIIVEKNLFETHDLKSSTFSVCSELVKAGANFSDIVDQVSRSKTKRSALISAHCLSKCKFLSGGRIAWLVVKKKDLRRFKAKDYDIDAVPSEMRSLKGVEIAVLFREKSPKILRVSLRSSGRINIGRLAEKHLGGGHYDIAGCLIPNDENSIKKMLSMAKGFLKEAGKMNYIRKEIENL